VTNNKCSQSLSLNGKLNRLALQPLERQRAALGALTRIATSDDNDLTTTAQHSLVTYLITQRVKDHAMWTTGPIGDLAALHFAQGLTTNLPHLELTKLLLHTPKIGRVDPLARAFTAHFHNFLSPLMSQAWNISNNPSLRGELILDEVVQNMRARIRDQLGNGNPSRPTRRRHSFAHLPRAPSLLRPGDPLPAFPFISDDVASSKPLSKAEEKDFAINFQSLTMSAPQASLSDDSADIEVDGSVTAIGAVSVGDNKWEVVTNSGKENTGKDVIAFAVERVANGAREILLTSFDRDGTRSYNHDPALLLAVSEAVNVDDQNVPMQLTTLERQVDDFVTWAVATVGNRAERSLLNSFPFSGIRSFAHDPPLHEAVSKALKRANKTPAVLVTASGGACRDSLATPLRTAEALDDDSDPNHEADMMRAVLQKLENDDHDYDDFGVNDDDY
jgi:hypothetical protein